SWDFSTNGATIEFSLLLHADGQVSGNKIQLGILNSATNGLNDNTGVAFESFRFIPSSATVWSLREQYRTAGTLAENTLGTVNVTIGHWYQFVVGLSNTAGATGNYTAACGLYDFGVDGLTPGADVVTFATVRNNTGQMDVTVPAVWPAFRGFQDAGLDAWDDFLGFTGQSPPVLTIALTNTTVTAGRSVVFNAHADGPGAITYAWYTNGIAVAGAAGAFFQTPPLTAAYKTVAVVASNANGAVTNAVALTVLTPTPPVVANLAASGVQGTLATLNGQVLSTGNEAPQITIYYGPSDEGTNAAAWAQSVAVGNQTGVFARTVGGLVTNTTYFFTAAAVNSAGTAWAAPSETFRTMASNALPAAVAVLTQHNDNGRTGANLQETALNTADVNTNLFGLLYTRPVDDQVYAQPLVMTNVAVAGQGTRNLLLVATVNDTVYAFDADDPSVTQPYWTRSFISPPSVVPPRNSDMTGACGGNYKDFSGNIGIVDTPVIDASSGTLYVLARTKENGTTFVQRVHALDVATGAERAYGPVVVSATYPGSGDGSAGGLLTFDPQKENQRAGLALANGILYVAWSSHCDWGPYHGWVMGFDAATLQLAATYVDTPNGSNGGIWMSGQAPAADAQGNIYLSTGNGTVDIPSGVDRGQSLLKLTRAGSTLEVASWFTPADWSNLNGADLDLGSAGLLLVPGTTLAMSGGKAGVVYVVNRDDMGGVSGSGADTNIVQSWAIAGGGHQLHGGPVWWVGPNGSFAYLWAQDSEVLRQYQFANGLFDPTPYALGPTVGGAGSPGGILSVSANGTNAGSGILWATVNTTYDANQAVVPGTLHAYDAENVAHELWNSDLLARDALGNLAKFVPPTVANGQVYVATFSGRLDVYGLFPRPALAVIAVGNGRLTVAWPVVDAGYHLQSSTEPGSGAWSDVAVNVVTANGALEATVPTTGATTYYRLKSP
ncbi:MAG: hypothetical protein KGS61_12330, partial [Verrucomicrobia bacterium]|nr:hypothetical protein [Verrucomicrobiota bacterium]